MGRNRREDAFGVRKKPAASSARSSGRRGTAKEKRKIDVGKAKKAGKITAGAVGRSCSMRWQGSWNHVQDASGVSGTAGDWRCRIWRI